MGVNEVVMWAAAANLILLVRAALRAPEALRLHAEAAMLREQVAMLRAQTEKEKVALRVTDADHLREMTKGFEARLKLAILDRKTTLEAPCDTAERS